MTRNIGRLGSRVFFHGKTECQSWPKNESKTCIFFMLALNGINIPIRMIGFDNIYLYLYVSHPIISYSFALMMKHKCFHGGLNIFGQLLFLSF